MASTSASDSAALPAADGDASERVVQDRQCDIKADAVETASADTPSDEQSRAPPSRAQDGEAQQQDGSPERSKRQREQDEQIDGTDEDSALDGCSRTFTSAQVRIKVKRARLEAKIAGNEEMARLRLALLQLEQKVEDTMREKKTAEERAALLQCSLDGIVEEHRRTLTGMKDSLQLEQLVASLDVEKAAKTSLREVLEKRTAELLRAQERLRSLEEQIDNYQKTENVLAQSVSHFQLQWASKEQQRAIQVDRIRHELEGEHGKVTAQLAQELEASRQVNDKLVGDLEVLRKEHIELQESAQGVLDLQSKKAEVETELRGRIAQLETEKAVLQSKVDQVQKADAQLRKTIQLQQEQLAASQQELDGLRRENQELTQIASDLMDMAERAQAERQEQQQPPNEAHDQALARTRQRLRDSIG